MPPRQFVIRAKRVLLAAGFLFGLAVASVSAVRAHAVVKPESFDDSVLKPHRATTVTLQFNVAIHARFARVYLLDATGKEQLLVTRSGEGLNRLIVELPALAPGAYALRYRVLASDGHYTDNALRFRVRAEP